MKAGKLKIKGQINGAAVYLAKIGSSSTPFCSDALVSPPNLYPPCSRPFFFYCSRNVRRCRPMHAQILAVLQSLFLLFYLSRVDLLISFIVRGRKATGKWVKRAFPCEREYALTPFSVLSAVLWQLKGWFPRQTLRTAWLIIQLTSQVDLLIFTVFFPHCV